jgi:hypothetical protein
MPWFEQKTEVLLARTVLAAISTLEREREKNRALQNQVQKLVNPS